MGKIRNELFLKHEINSIRNPDLLELIQKQGLEGYAVYWLLLEYLQGTETGTIQEEKIEKIASTCLQTDAEKASEIVKTCLEIHLLEYSNDGENSNDGEREIYSPMLAKQRDEIKAEKEQKSKAGRKGQEAKKEMEAIAAGKPQFATLCKEICDKFGDKVKPMYYKKQSELLEDLMLDGLTIEEAAATVRKGLAKLDTAKAIKNGKIKFTINSFFDPKLFRKLLADEYEKDFSERRPRSRAADAGVTFSDMDY